MSDGVAESERSYLGPVVPTRFAGCTHANHDRITEGNSFPGIGDGGTPAADRAVAHRVDRPSDGTDADPSGFLAKLVGRCGIPGAVVAVRAPIQSIAGELAIIPHYRNLHGAALFAVQANFQ